MLDTLQVSQEVYNYDQFNNRTDVSEYDYGPNAPGPLVRHLHTDYLTTNNGIDYTSPFGPHLRSLPQAETVYQINSGSATQVQTAQTVYSYDFQTLPARPGIVGLDSAFGTSYQFRGNVIQMSRWLNTSSQSVTTTFQYDVAGNVVSTTDPNGNTITFAYDDDFGAPDGNATVNTAPPELSGGSTFAFRTTVRNALS